MKRTLLAFYALIIFYTITAQVSSYETSPGLVGWWPFNGNANDVSGNGNNGTVNGATLTTDRFGTANKANSFDGIIDYIQTDIKALNNSTHKKFYLGYLPVHAVSTTNLNMPVFDLESYVGNLLNGLNKINKLIIPS